MGDNTFLLVGNGPYLNRGCEAIIRGTVRILRHHFDALRFEAYTVYRDPGGLARQRAQEKDPDIHHDEVRNSYKRFDRRWFTFNILKRTCPPALKHLWYSNLKSSLPSAQAVLAVGGDNYSLDYHGPPRAGTELDDLVTSRGKPLIIWGASVGPFSKNPAYEKYIIEHFRKVHIFARESLTHEYLNAHGLIDNVYRVADPAFVMDAVQPPREKLDVPLEQGAIGINLSPLLAKYNANWDLAAWAAQAASILRAVIDKTGRMIYLIPHVTGIDPKHDDHAFLGRVAELLDGRKDRVFVVPNTLDAAETKWVISRMHLFAGARTHSTIAAISSAVPTLSFGYSIKSRGINQDIYGHTRYCLQGNQLAPEMVADRVSEMLSDHKNIAEQLKASIPRMKTLALNAGDILKTIVHA